MKLFRKIRETLIKEGSLKRYLLYAIGEILLVMIGISLAFQVNNWNDGRIQRNAEIKYYENIRDQIVNDEQLIQGQLNYNINHMAQFKYANEIIETNDRSKMDTLGIIVRNLTNYSDFDREGNIYETMVNSGEIKLLRNHNIVEGIRELEEQYNYINRMEKIHYDAIMNHIVLGINNALKLSNNQIEKPDHVFSYEFQNMILILMQIMKEKNNTYASALDEIESTISFIDKELVDK